MNVVSKTMFKLNSFCKECFDPHKIIWNCKKHLSDKDWIFLCGNCIRYYKHLNGRNFKSQFQNIKSLIKCRLHPTKIAISIFKAN